jgi:hypothetical protein
LRTDRVSHQAKNFVGPEDGRSHSTAATMASRPISTICIALTLLSVALNASCAETPDVKVQGPWAYTRQVQGASEAVRDVATTAAVDDSNVWLLLACDEDRRVTVSIMHVEELPFRVGSEVNVSLRIDDHPKLTMPAISIHNQQISIGSGSSHDLLPLLVGGNQSFVTIPDSRGEPHEYGFKLQPNDIALSSIRANCLDPVNR